MICLRLTCLCVRARFFLSLSLTYCTCIIVDCFECTAHVEKMKIKSICANTQTRAHKHTQWRCLLGRCFWSSGYKKQIIDKKSDAKQWDKWIHIVRTRLCKIEKKCKIIDIECVTLHSVHDTRGNDVAQIVCRNVWHIINIHSIGHISFRHLASHWTEYRPVITNHWQIWKCNASAVYRVICKNGRCGVQTTITNSASHCVCIHAFVWLKLFLINADVVSQKCDTVRS